MSATTFGFELPTVHGMYWRILLWGDGEERPETDALIVSVEEDTAPLGPGCVKYPGLRVIDGSQWIWSGREEERRRVTPAEVSVLARSILEGKGGLPHGQRLVEGIPLAEFVQTNGWVGVLWAGPLPYPSLHPSLLVNRTERRMRIRAGDVHGFSSGEEEGK